MANMSDYLENKLIDHIFRNTSFTMPATIYISLFTASPTDTNGGTEVSGGSYARVALNPSVSNWLSTNGTNSGASSGTGGTTSNNAVITFATPTGNWGAITHIGIHDALTTGNLLFWSALTTPKTVNNADTAPSFAVGALTCQLDN